MALKPSNDAPTPLARTLLSLRLKRDLTQAEFADEYGFSQPSVSNWENGKQEPQASTLLKLARIHGVELSAMLAGHDPQYDAMIASRRRGGTGTADGEAPQHAETQARVLEVRTDALRRLAKTVDQVTARLLESVGVAKNTFTDDQAGTPARRTARTHRRPGRRRG